MQTCNIYENIKARTGGSVYIGVVGPVRTGKSTFIKKFMETLVIPNIDDKYMKERAKDELPQSGSGRMIMTSEPKFVPEDAVNVSLEEGTELSVRLIDCVGYMVPGALGDMEDDAPRKVTTPWFDREVTMAEAAETGTKKVIMEHSTIGIVITTDGSVTEFDRENYIEAETRVIEELKAIGKPFVILLNTENPASGEARALSESLAEKYGVTCVAKNCMELTQEDVKEVIRSVLYEFPIGDIGVYIPSWVDALPYDHPVKSAVMAEITENIGEVTRIFDVKRYVSSISEKEKIERASVSEIDLGTGYVSVRVDLARGMFYETLSEQSGMTIVNDGNLMNIVTELAETKRKYDKIASALEDVRTKGYGVVFPGKDELTLQEPEIVKHGGRYSVKLKASAPSIHMIMANVETEVSPAVGGEKTSGDIINYLLQEFEGDTGKIWESNIFGKSLYDIAGEGLNTKIKYMPEDAQKKLRQTLERIINEGSTGLICIII